MAELTKLKAQRKTIKGTLTRIETFVSSININDITDKQQINALILDLQVRETLLSSTFTTYQQVQLDIEMLEAAQASDREGTENKYLTLLANIKGLIEKLNITKSTATVREDAGSSVDGHSKPRNNLPAVNIPVFDGKDINQFKPFYDLYTVLVHKDGTLSAVQKLFYLRNYLKNEALALISELPLTNDSYPEAIDILEKRYNNPTIVINAHIKALLETPSVAKGGAHQLRDFVSRIKQHIASLKSLKQPVEHWDTLLVYIFSQKLDNYTNRAYQLDKDLDKLPYFTHFIEFLENRAKALESANDSGFSFKSKPKISTLTSVKFTPSKTKTQTTNQNSSSQQNQKCPFCDDTKHKIYQCLNFAKLQLDEKLDYVKKSALCMNCLRPHLGECRLSGCKKCGNKHHTLIHPDEKLSSNHASLVVKPLSPHVLLPTALVNIRSRGGEYVLARALLDSGSQTSFITRDLVQRLCLKTQSKIFNISALTDNTITTNQYTEVEIASSVYNFKITVPCVVIHKITTPLPQATFNTNNLKIPSTVLLADRNFNKTSNIDILLGANIFFKLLLTGTIKLGNSNPVLQNTLLGYIVSGEIPDAEVLSNKTSNPCTVSLHSSAQPQLDELLEKFWDQETIKEVQPLSGDKCELIFKESVKRINGRFQVNLPLVKPVEGLKLGDSLGAAVKRFHNLEKRFSKDRSLVFEYRSFIKEYLDLGHAKIISTDISSLQINLNNTYFLAHHPVIRQDKISTKVRVVFDGSMKTKNQISLNDMQYKGPVVQPELFEILLRFRLYKYAFVTDIKQMYRQIQIHPSHRQLQNILWRTDPQSPLQCLQLQTVTYGLKSSPFLATRCLNELAVSQYDNYPHAAETPLHNCYVDDVLSGAETIEQAVQLQKQLIELLQSARFELHKWCANDERLLLNIPINKRHCHDIDLHQDSNIKTLGISYSTRLDAFKMACPIKELEIPYTKRNILSFIAKFYDPLGFCVPVLVRAKLLLQKLWKDQLPWDEPVSNEIKTIWENFATDLIKSQPIQIPRHILLHAIKHLEIIGFCDASMVAYGCCIYIRTLNGQKASTTLFCSKSRVAPLNKILTIPKLELNSAVFLSELTVKIVPIFQSYNPQIFLYTDSTIVLAWINTCYHTREQYVASRINKIQNITNELQCNWLHVKSEHNPADHLSRGVDMHTLCKLTSWWCGPTYLEDIHYNQKANNFAVNCTNLPELKPVTQTNTMQDPMNIDFEKYSNINKLIRIIAYCKRFLHNIKSLSQKCVGNLTIVELREAFNSVIRLIQKAHFSEDIQRLCTRKHINSSLKNLTPFIDSNGIIRVGGRLENANLSFQQKHPVILPPKNHVTKLIIQNEHNILLHAGQKTVLNNLRQRFWVLNGNKEVKAVIIKCVPCHRYKKHVSQQIMGDLPSDRVVKSRVFERVGIDFAGPLNIKQSRIRRAVITKSYITLFVCFTTKAIHLELVSDLRTDTFLAALKRFVGRRGCPSVIYSDNGSTFKGASNKLNDVYKFFNVAQNHIVDHLSLKGIEWKFIPNYSPNFGGLWEAAVKSTKHHLKRVTENSSLTYEEMQTVLIQIEAILNSRPLCPLTNDIHDFNTLTPGHFLIGQPLTTIPEVDITTQPINRLSFWKQCVSMQQHFWKRWHKEYLNQLQNRPKWHKQEENIKLGQLVLIQEKHLPPNQWALARVTKTIPGQDGKVRVVEIINAKANKSRIAISKISSLPIEVES